MSRHYSSAWCCGGCRPAATLGDLSSSIHQPQAHGPAAPYPPAISITSIFFEHNSCYSAALRFSLHLLQSVNVNYISLCEPAPSITCRSRQTQVNWSTALICSCFPSHNPLTHDKTWWTGREELETRHVAAMKGPEMERCEIHRLVRYTSSLSQGQTRQYACMQTHTFTHMHMAINPLHTGRDIRRREKLN